MEKPFLTAAIIARNEQGCIDRCLKSLKGFDEIVVLDTGSTDATIDICFNNRAKVYHSIWDDDFGETRNKLLTYCNGDWVLSIDADEYLVSSPKEIREICLEKRQVISVNVVTEKENCLQNRLYRRKQSIFWRGVYHECLNTQADTVSSIEIRSTNDGWGRRNDPDRGIRILTAFLKKSPNSPRETYYLGKEYLYRGSNEMAIFYLNEASFMYGGGRELADIYLCLGKAYIGVGLNHRSIESLSKALIVNPDMSEAYTLLYHLTKNKSYLKIAKVANNKNVLVYANR
jgi:glycosyltransferase involved in cell wall biosynthesis